MVERCGIRKKAACFHGPPWSEGKSQLRSDVHLQAGEDFPLAGWEGVGDEAGLDHGAGGDIGPGS